MANTVFKLRRSTVAGKKPTTTDIAIGELAVNLTDKKLFSSDGSNTWEIGSNLTTLNVSTNTTVNNVIFSGGVYANGDIGSSGQVLSSNGSSLYWATVTGTGTVTSVASGNGLSGGPVTTSGTLSVLANNGIVANSTGLFVNPGQTTVVNSSGVFVNLASSFTWSNAHTFNANVTANNISISGNISTVDSIYFDNASIAATSGILTWNPDESTLDLGLAGNSSILQIGQETLYRVKNQTGSTINNGTVVMANGTLGSSGRIKVTPAVANGTYPSQYIMGIATENIVDGSDGYVTHFGKVRDVNTASWAAGSVLYADPANTGGLTSTKPTAPNNKTIVALVIHSDVSNGVLFVRPTFGSSLADDELAELSSLANGDVLIYNSTNKRFQNYSQGILNVNNATTVGGNTASDLRSYSDTKSATAYSNATSYADTKAATAYSNAVSYTDTKIATANTAMVANASAAYTNAVSYVDGLKLDSVTNTSISYIPVANTVKNAYDRAIDANTRAASAQSAAISAYSNATSYADTKAATAYSNSTSYADTKSATAYSNAVSYTDTKISTANSAITGNAATAYSNAVSYVDGKSYVNTSQLSSNLSNYQTTAGLSGNVATLTSNNATYAYGKTEGNLNVNSATQATNATNLNSQPGSYYTNATNITTGTLPYAQIPANIVNTTSNFTISGVHTYNANVALLGNSISTFTVSNINATSNGVFIGNNVLQVGNTSVYANLAPAALYIGGNSIANSTGANNAFNLGGTAAASYQLNSTLSANVATLTANNTTYVNGKTEGNLNVNSATTALTANNATNLGGTAAASYQLNSTLNANIASYLPTYTGVVNGSSHTVGATFTANSTVVNAVSYYAGTTLIGNTTGPYGKAEGNLNVNSALTANNSTNLGGTAASGYQTTAGLSANVATLSANNTTYLNGQLASYYTNATNITTGTLPYAQIPANIVNTSGTFTISGVYTHSGNLTVNGVLGVNNVIALNGSNGTAGFVLTSNGNSNAYWAAAAAGTNTAAQYTWSNTQTFQNTITFSTSILGNTINATSYNTGGGFGTATGGITINSTAIGVGNSTINSYSNSVMFTAEIGHSNRQNLDIGTYTTDATLNTVIAGPYTVSTGNSLVITAGSRVVIV